MKRRRIVLGFCLAAAVGASGPAAALTRCEMTFTMKGWAAFYHVAKGSGTITCDNGQHAAVLLEAKGGGIAAGKYAIREGHGKFSELADIGELFGSYIRAEAGAGAGKAAAATAMTKGEVSLALTGKGTGVELGFTFGKFTITRQ
jgi:hypothetical protein